MSAFNYRDQSERALSLHDKYVDLGVKYFDDTVNKLLYLSSFSLGFALFLLDKFSGNLNCFLSFLFILGTLSFTISLVCGLTHKLSSNTFFNKVSDIYYQHHILINRHLVDSGKTEGDEPLNQLIDLPAIPNSSPDSWFKLIVTFFLLGVLSYITIVINLI